MNKFKAGGRCGGDSGINAKEDTQGVKTSLSALLAARDAQDRAFTSTAPVIQEVTPAQQAIVIAKKPIADKQKIMDLILQGDMSDD